MTHIAGVEPSIRGKTSVQLDALEGRFVSMVKEIYPVISMAVILLDL